MEMMNDKEKGTQTVVELWTFFMRANYYLGWHEETIAKQGITVGSHWTDP
jgi:hypothetical protein